MCPKIHHTFLHSSKPFIFRKHLIVYKKLHFCAKRNQIANAMLILTILVKTLNLPSKTTASVEIETVAKIRSQKVVQLKDKVHYSTVLCKSEIFQLNTLSVQYKMQYILHRRWHIYEGHWTIFDTWKNPVKNVFQSHKKTRPLKDFEK